MGIGFEKRNDILIVTGKGFKKLSKPVLSLDAGNSGTTTRLITGILVNQDFDCEITGDESLSLRPMRRVIDPLTLMGGKIEATPAGTLPIKISGSCNLHPIEYILPMASAQVKSAVLLAGIHLDEETRVIEKSGSRDHTERMLGLKISHEGENKISTRQVHLDRRSCKPDGSSGEQPYLSSAEKRG